MTAPAFKTAEHRERAARPERPRLRAVLTEQVRATGLALRGPALIVAALVALLTLVAWLQSVSIGVVRNFYEWPTLLPGLIGALLPAAVWARDEPYGQGYLWTLPVDRHQLTLIKVFAGWVWLMAGVALFALWWPILTIAYRGGVLPPGTLYLLTSQFSGTGPLDPASLEPARWAPGVMIWGVPFTAATASYLLGSAFMLASRRPLRWLIGIGLSYALLSLTSDAAGRKLGMEWLADGPAGLLELLVRGRYGLDAVLTARTGTLSTTLTLTTGERAMVWRAVPDLADWRIATLLWTAIGALALWAAASRHREKRRI